MPVDDIFEQITNQILAAGIKNTRLWMTMIKQRDQYQPGALWSRILPLEDAKRAP